MDLPQKMLVWQEANGTVKISYNDPDYLANRHGIAGNTDTLDKIKAALQGLATGAAAI